MVEVKTNFFPEYLSEPYKELYVCYLTQSAHNPLKEYSCSHFTNEGAEVHLGPVRGDCEATDMSIHSNASPDDK